MFFLDMDQKCLEKCAECSSTGCSTHPHNIYLQFLSELGLFGFIFIIYILIILIKFHINNFNKIFIINDERYNFKICLLSSFLISLWPVIPSGNFFNNWLSIIMFLPVGFLLYIESNNN